MLKACCDAVYTAKKKPVAVAPWTCGWLSEFERDDSLINKDEAEKITELIELFNRKFENGENINYHLFNK